MDSGAIEGRLSAWSVEWLRAAGCLEPDVSSYSRPRLGIPRVMNAVVLLNISNVRNFVNQHFQRKNFRIGAAKPFFS